jgi:predicted Holliday junction resolvase-like endonuclease
MLKIIIVILIIIVFIFLINYYKLFDLENYTINLEDDIEKFISSRNTNSSSSNVKLIHGTKTGNNKISNQIQNKTNTAKNNISMRQQISNVDSKVLFNNKDYNENLSIDNKDNKYYYDDMIDQSNINETAFNIVYSIDPIDYADVKTGIQKCNEDCEGVCYENGYDGIATCYPKETKNFDWGTLYKNPTFTYGYNAYGPNNLKQ